MSEVRDHAVAGLWHARVKSERAVHMKGHGKQYDIYKARLHGSPRLINTVESIKLNSTVERYCLHGSTKVNEAVDFKMAARQMNLCEKVLL